MRQRDPVRDANRVSKQEIVKAVKLGVAAMGNERSGFSRYSGDRNSTICVDCMGSFGLEKLGV